MPFSRRTTALALPGLALGALLGACGRWGGTRRSEPKDAPAAEVTAHGDGARVGFVGDSFSYGTAASAPAKRWTSVLSAALGVTEVNVAIPGMGYLAGGRTKNYVAQLHVLAPQRPDVVVISGGWNDVAHGFAAARILSGLSDALSTSRRLMPDARVVVVAPVGAAKAPPSALMTLRDEARPVVERAGATYVDLNFPLTGHPEWISPDGLHPNDAGYARLAALTIPAVRDAVEAIPRR